MYTFRLLTILILSTSLMAAGWGGVEHNLRVRGNYVFYCHKNAGVFVLNQAGLSVQRFYSVPGTPSEVDGETTRGTVYAACGGGVAVGRITSNSAEWIPDTITYGYDLLGDWVQMQHGFSDVVVCDGHSAFFSHSYDASGASGMDGYVGVLDLEGHVLEDVSGGGTGIFRAYQELAVDQTNNRVFAGLYAAAVAMFDGVTGDLIETSASGITPQTGDCYDFHFDRTKVQGKWHPMVGGSYFWPVQAGQPLQNKVATSYIRYTTEALLEAHGTYADYEGTRPLRYHRDFVFHGLIGDSDSFDGLPGIAVVDYFSGESVFFETEALGPVETLLVDDDRVYGDCASGVVVVSAVTDVTPIEIAAVSTGGQGPFVPLGPELMVAGAEGGGISVNGSVPVYLVTVNSGGVVNTVDLSGYTLQADSATPPVASHLGITLVTITGDNFTPDTRVWLDLDRAYRNGDMAYALNHEVTDVLSIGLNNMTFTMPGAALGPVDLILTNNGTRQWATVDDPVVIDRPPINFSSTNGFFVVDTESDPLDLHPDDAEDGDSPGGIYYLNSDTGQLGLVTSGSRFDDPYDIVRDPDTGGHFVALSMWGGNGYIVDEGGVFSLDPSNGFFNVSDNLYVTGGEWGSPEQIVFLEDGRMFVLDSTRPVEGPDDAGHFGWIYEVGTAGTVVQEVTSTFWNQPRTLDLGPDGNLYVGDPGGTPIFGGDDPTWLPALHRIEPDTGLTEIVFAHRLIGFPLDAVFGSDGALYAVTMLGAFEGDAAYDLVYDAWVDGQDLSAWQDAYTSEDDDRADVSGDGTANGLDLLDFSRKWSSHGGLTTAIVKIQLFEGPPKVELIFIDPQIMPMALQFDAQDNLVFVAADSIWGFFEFGQPNISLYQYDPEGPENPLLKCQLEGLHTPRRLVRYE